jgi:hypothetical protein
VRPPLAGSWGKVWVMRFVFSGVTGLMTPLFFQRGHEVIPLLTKVSCHVLQRPAMQVGASGAP